MNAQITQLLESSNPQDRKKAIRMMTTVGGSEVLRALAGLYKYDDDPQIRELALEAGRLIKKQETAERTAAAPVQSPTKSTIVPPAAVIEENDTEDEEEEDLSPVVVSAGKIQQAKGLLERALDLSMRGEQEKSLDSLIKAFKINPNYRTDSYALGIAMDTTGMDRSEFLALLKDDKQIRGLKNETKQRSNEEKIKRGEIPDPGWDEVFLDLGLYYVLIAGGIMIALLVGSQMYRGAAAAAAQGCATCLPQDIKRMSEIISYNQAAFSYSPVQGILYGLIGGLIVVGYMPIYFGILHVIARLTMSQDGSYRGIIKYGSRVAMIGYGVGIGAIGIGILIMLSMTLNPRFYEINGLDAKSVSTTPLVFMGGGLLANYLSGLWLSQRIGTYYDTSWSNASRATYFTHLITSGTVALIVFGLFQVFILPTLPHITPK